VLILLQTLQTLKSQPFHWDENQTQNFFLTNYNQWLYIIFMSAKELKLWRKRWGITQVDLARRLGTHQVTIARWETGARKIPFLLPLALEALENRIQEGN
jgi:DNA-binding transcriptional regulator YiaG